jgi:DNA-binding transcriptional regulator GbsR (MarR family)
MRKLLVFFLVEYQLFFLISLKRQDVSQVLEELHNHSLIEIIFKKNRKCFFYLEEHFTH